MNGQAHRALLNLALDIINDDSLPFRVGGLGVRV
jgi:hypothetical protein